MEEKYPGHQKSSLHLYSSVEAPNLIYGFDDPPGV